MYLEKTKRQDRRWGTHPVLSSRLTTGAFHLMFEKHRQYEDKFYQYYRMSVSSFDELLHLVSDGLMKKDTNMKRSIEPAERLAITIRYLGCGMNFSDLEFEYQVSRKTIRLVVEETCETISGKLQSTEMPIPTSDEWLLKATEYEKLTNFPNCVGAIDGKHVPIQCPPSSGSLYYNFRKYFSLVLFAVSDAQCNFTAIDVGAYGREGDSTIFKNSNFYKRLNAGQLNLPTEKPLSPEGPTVPFVFLGDEAFGLTTRVMRPYPQKKLTKERSVYNYRHCRARRTVECAFGIMSNKWRVMHSCILVNPIFATKIIQSCCVLHNYVKRRDGYIFEESLTCDMDCLVGAAVGSGRSNGLVVRDLFCEYFNGPGALNWQNQYA
ncbi:protein ANTAGONIST OF LIKE HETEROCHROMATIN PROTEIN 1-like [Homalodisca vitripennis]|uniref:protein ANTAGONIST OF LIKE HETEROCHROMATIN PROTEIN 1-like n=1 Tax=Homalodisca vitripennis TaxID=197043 RepID=UPI001EEBF012|nr:protein ANTAGONIST OF LIKE HETEROCHROMATIN PROTEIN 1-like [Homalodisca vitripennis]